MSDGSGADNGSVQDETTNSNSPKQRVVFGKEQNEHENITTIIVPLDTNKLRPGFQCNCRAVTATEFKNLPPYSFLRTNINVTRCRTVTVPSFFMQVLTLPSTITCMSSECWKAYLFCREARCDVEENHITSSYRICILKQILFSKKVRPSIGHESPDRE